jgi:hypothetical protein
VKHHHRRALDREGTRPMPERRAGLLDPPHLGRVRPDRMVGRMITKSLAGVVAWSLAPARARSCLRPARRARSLPLALLRDAGGRPDCLRGKTLRGASSTSGAGGRGGRSPAPVTGSPPQGSHATPSSASPHGAGQWVRPAADGAGTGLRWTTTRPRQSPPIRRRERGTSSPRCAAGPTGAPRGRRLGPASAAGRRRRARRRSALFDHLKCQLLCAGPAAASRGGGSWPRRAACCRWGARRGPHQPLEGSRQTRGVHFVRFCRVAHVPRAW